MLSINVYLIYLNNGQTHKNMQRNFIFIANVTMDIKFIIIKENWKISTKQLI